MERGSNNNGVGLRDKRNESEESERREKRERKIVSGILGPLATPLALRCNALIHYSSDKNGYRV
jgi:hypothetical protein